MKIKVTSVYVNNQDNALRFYTEVLGFAKKTDFSQGPYRWLTVASPEEPDGTELQLALNNNPAAKTYQEALFQQNQPAAMHVMGAGGIFRGQIARSSPAFLFVWTLHALGVMGMFSLILSVRALWSLRGGERSSAL